MASASASNAVIASVFPRNNASTIEVGWFPHLSQMSLGGAPSKPAKSAKSASWETRTNPFARAKIPNLAIESLLQAQLACAARSREDISQLSAELEAEILIEEQLHAAVVARRSRSAAYTRLARMSPSVSSG